MIMNTLKSNSRITFTLVLIINSFALPIHSMALYSDVVRTEEMNNLIYKQDFEDFRSICDFVFARPDDWQINSTDENSYLEYTGSGNDNIALLVRRRLKDYTMEFDIMVSSGVRWAGDFHVIYNFREPGSFSHILLNTNDIPIADYYDTDVEFAADKGFIGFQVHWPVNTDTIGKLRWRNIKIKEL